MSTSKLRERANAVRDQMLREYVAFGRQVSAAVEEHSGTPMVKLRITRPSKPIPQRHFRSSGIVVEIDIIT